MTPLQEYVQKHHETMTAKQMAEAKGVSIGHIYNTCQKMGVKAKPGYPKTKNTAGAIKARLLKMEQEGKVSMAVVEEAMGALVVAETIKLTNGSTIKIVDTGEDLVVGTGSYNKEGEE